MTSLNSSGYLNSNFLTNISHRPLQSYNHFNLIIFFLSSNCIVSYVYHLLAICLLAICLDCSLVHFRNYDCNKIGYMHEVNYKKILYYGIRSS